MPLLLKILFYITVFMFIMTWASATQASGPATFLVSLVVGAIVNILIQNEDRVNNKGNN